MREGAARVAVLVGVLCAACIANVGCAGFSYSSNQNTAPVTFTIQGTITPGPNNINVAVTLSGSANATTQTDSFGNYSFSALANGNYTVAPSRSGLSFSPATQNVAVNGANVTGLNFRASEAAPNTFSLSGTVGPAAGGSGATLTLSGSATAVTAADSEGNYVFPGLASGNYTVTPSKNGYSFTPASQNETISTSNVTGVNFTAASTAPATFSLSGTISPAAGGNGAIVTLGGAVTASTAADSQGNYSFNGLPAGNYTITPSNSGFTFAPASQNKSISANSVSGVDFTASSTPPPTFTLSGTISPAAGGSGALVRLSGAANTTTTADNGGNYSFSGLTSGSYTVTPSNSGYSFTPPSQSEIISASNVSGANFTASSTNTVTFSISGTISPAASGGGSAVILSGPARLKTTADSSGNYIFTGLASGEYTVTPSDNGYNFTPASQNANVTTTDLAGLNFTASAVPGNTVDINPGDDIPSIVSSAPAGTTFIIFPGTYRLTQPIIPKNNDAFIGQSPCAPPASACAAIISGSEIIGPLATFNGTNYVVTGQTQKNSVFQTTAQCTPGWLACNIPEDLWFDGVPLQHLYASSLPVIASGQWWFDYTNHIIYFHDNPAGHLVETSVVPHVAIGPASNVTFQYLTIEEFSVPLTEGGFWPSLGQTSDAYRQANGLNWIIENCEMWGHHSAPISPNYGMQVWNNYIHDNGEFGIGGNVGPDNNMIPSGLVIEGNLITHNNYANVLPDWGAGGIKFGRTHGAVLRNNTVTNNEGAGIHFDVSSSSPVVVGNTITGNTDGDGIGYEISLDSAVIYNNVLKYNGAPSVAKTWPNYQINSSSSAGVNAYCNVMEMSAVSGEEAWVVQASNRGYDPYPPGNYYTSTGNNFHHNTLIWDTNSGGTAGFMQGDAANQPNFFADNTAPDFNTHHLASLSTANFQYDNNNSQQNSRLTFVQYQAAGADPNGSIDTNYTSGFPAISITSPADNSFFTNSLIVEASATDNSGISKVEFYVDWNLQATVVASPFNFTWTNASSGTHTVAAMAYSNAGIRACSAVMLTKQ